MSSGPRPDLITARNPIKIKNMKTKDELIEWLRDAYAMEVAMEMALKKHIDNEKVSARMREQASIHYVETQGHAQAVHDCLHSLGADTSALKTTLARGLEFMKGTGTMFAKDERVKDVLAAYASEHFEIACYSALRTAAQEAGIAAIVKTCDAIIAEEMNMARWLQDNLPSVVKDYLKEKS
jgi:ferritin-like metal-binding protein YciE